MRCFTPGVLTLCLMLCACGPTGNTDAGPPGQSSGGTSNGTSTGTNNNGGTAGAAVMSHNAGQDCISCHKSGGTGASKGVFTVAGTVYNNNGGAQTSATVTIYAAGSNNVQATLSTDGLGNFWTTQTIAALVPASGQTLVQGVNAVVRPTGGSSRSMLGVISNGSCNSCHSSAGGVARVTAQLLDSGPSVHTAAAAGNGESGATAATTSGPALAQIATGVAHGCVVKADGTVLCWGSNAQGQLGANVSGDQSAPVVVTALGHVTAATTDHSIAAGDNHTCVIASTGNLVLCWGTTQASIVPLSGVTALSASGDSTCARAGAGDSASFYCWGAMPQRVDVNAAKLPDALIPLLDAGAPVVTAMTASNVVGLETTSFTQIVAAAEHSCGITTDNHVKCWEGTHASVDIPLL